MQIEVLPCTEETERSSNQAEEISTSQSSQAQDHRDDGAEIGSPPPKKRKRQRKHCSVDKCTNKAIAKGVCKNHGAAVTCKVEGCSFQALNKRDGVCNTLVRRRENQRRKGNAALSMSPRKTNVPTGLSRVASV
jgi:hypothetical protein